MKMKNLLLVLGLAILSFTSVFAEKTIVRNFDTRADTVNVTTSAGAEITWIANPDKTGLNQSDSCFQIARTGVNWWEMINIPVNIVIPANTTETLHVMVKYPAQPDFVLRLNNDKTSNIRPNVFYSKDHLGEWQVLDFDIVGGSTGITLFNFTFFTDAGWQNDPLGFVLNNSDKLGYIDEIILGDISTDISLDAEKKNYVLTSANGMISVTMAEAKQIVVYNSVGAMLKSSFDSQLEFEAPLSGLYIVKIGDKTEKVLVK